MRELLRHVRRTPERLLHPWRRRKALEALRARGRPKTLLVMCHGNICRSPVAAGLLERALIRLGVDVRSAGFIGFNRPAPADAITAAHSVGIDLTAHRSRLVTAELARSADLIVVMEPAQRRLFCERFGRLPNQVLLLGDLDPAAIESRSIRDPLDQGSRVFAEVYARIDRCVSELVQSLRDPRDLSSAVAGLP
jgi:protein-tyrosine phosphatase